ncbi:hypothetical protein GCM10023185_09110 [Hymenobacter saemangeumensis]|uniref:GH16 domain-containing protein n=1 Tax=Hymenobacter saemangeumensis TaxID=1084522 RepID=A0ABP8I4C8_9BACT
MAGAVLRILFLIVALLGLTYESSTAQQRRINYADWRLEWAEEFNEPTDTLALMARWRFAFPWGRNLINNLETQYYTGIGVQPDSAGTLHLVARLLDTPIVYQGKRLRYSSGMLMSNHPTDPAFRPANCPPDGNGFSYGLFEVRCRQPRDDRAFPAFWLWGGAPDEIDVFEANPHGFFNTLHSHTPGYWYPTRTMREGCSCHFFNVDSRGDLSQQYHTYTVEWWPDEVVFYYDGVPIRRATNLLPNGCAMYVIVNLAMWNWADQLTDSLSIDYIRIYRPRQPPQPVAVIRHGGEGPFSEWEWVPLDIKPGRDSGRRQRWQASPTPRGRLALELVDNLNPVCEITLPLPVADAGPWAPPWIVLDNVPDTQLHFTSDAPISWQLRDLMGRPVVTGSMPAGAWQPRWPVVPPGSYVLHLRQGAARAFHPVVFIARSPLDATPVPAWLEPAAPADAAPGEER